MNMPEVDEYGTVGPHTIIRQHMDYGHWYCRNKLSLKEIHNTQYVASMNPTAGSFAINPRLQRHFATFSVVFPTQESLFTIYNTILNDHIQNPSNKFLSPVKRLCKNIVNATLALHLKCSQVKFLLQIIPLTQSPGLLSHCNQVPLYLQPEGFEQRLPRPSLLQQ
jgi:dynein heavy chain